MEDRKNDAISKKVWMMKKNHGLERSMEDKKMMGLSQSMEDITKC